MLTLEQWRQKFNEMGGVSGVIKKCPGPNADFQVAGALCNKNAKKSKVEFVKKSKKY